MCGQAWAARLRRRWGGSGDQLQSAAARRPYATKRNAATCDVCGKVKRSNHNCKGKQPTGSVCPKCGESLMVIGETHPCKQWGGPEGCGFCERAGELCVRHGGIHVQREEDRIIPTERLKPSKLESVRPVPLSSVEENPELAAIGTILKALEGLNNKQIKRASVRPISTSGHRNASSN